jgi:hypothetical protein
MSNCQTARRYLKPQHIAGLTPGSLGYRSKTHNLHRLPFGNQRPGVGVDPSAQPRREQVCRADIVKTRSRPSDHQSGLLLLVNLYQAITPVPPVAVRRTDALAPRTQTAAVHISLLLLRSWFSRALFRAVDEQLIFLSSLFLTSP